MDILYLFAAAMERDAAAQWLRFPEDAEVAVGLCGVGLVDAAIGTAQLLVQHRPASVVFLGTCGAYPGSGVNVGDLVVASAGRLVTGDLLSGTMRLPGLVESRVAAHADSAELLYQQIRRSGIPVHRCDVASTPGITEDVALAEEIFASSGCLVENLEAYSVLQAASEHRGVVLLGVTNIVGPGGGDDWRVHHPRVMESLARAVAQGG